MTGIRSSKWAVLAVSSLAVFTDMVIYGVVMPILTTILGQFDRGSDADRSLLFVFYAVGLFVFTPIFGVVSDKYMNRQIPMLFGQAGLAACTILFAFANSFPLLIIARSLQGIAAAATWVVGFAMLTDVFTGKTLGLALSVVFGFHTLGFFLGPLIGGFSSRLFGFRAPFYFCSALALLDFVGRLWIKPAPPKAAINDPSNKSKASMFDLLRNSEVILVNVALILASCSFSSIEALLSKHLEDNFGYDPSQVSLVLVAFILPNIVMASLVGYASTRIDRFKIITLGLVLHPLVAPLVVSTSNINYTLIGAVLFGITASLISTPTMPEMAEVVDSLGGASYARVYAILNMCYSFGMVIGPAVASAIKSKSSFAVALTAITSLMFFFSPVFFICLRRLKKDRDIRLQNFKKLLESSSSEKVSIP